MDVSSFAAAGAPADLARLTLGFPPARLLLLVRDAHPATGEWLRAATEGAVAGVATGTGGDRMYFHDLPAGAGGELSGASLPRDRGSACALTPGATATSLLSSAGLTLWLRVDAGPAAGAHVWSCPGALAPEQLITEEKEIEGRLDAVLPLLAFLRGVHGAACWHNPHHHLGLIIDDPLVEPRYGCLDFPALLTVSRQIGLHVTLAFIPWNANRTTDAAAAPFRAQPDVFSLCLHGCDHTAGEYTATDPKVLRTLTAEALRRMATHTEQTSIPTQPLMVCPQERFSGAALGVLAVEPAIEAVVNSRFLPRDHQAGKVTVADLLRPALADHRGCTLIKRFYPHDAWKLALARFLGQPALLVEHHDYFRYGTGLLEQEIRRLRTADPTLTSPPLIQVVRQTHWRRVSGPRQLEFLVLTRRLDFSVTGPGPTQVRLVRPLPATVNLESVRVDGRAVAFQRTDDGLAVTLTDLSPGEHRFELILSSPPAALPYDRSLPQRAGIAARRSLSEFRDRVIAREERLLRLSQRVARLLRLRD